MIVKMDPYVLTQNPDSRSIALQTGAVAKLFQGKVLLQPNLASNTVGCFTLGSVGNNGTVLWGRLKGPSHLLKPRQNGCVWAPKGQIRADFEKVDMAPIEVQLEQCVDALWTESFERILGRGMDIRKIAATEEGRKMLSFMVNRIFDSLQESVSNLVWWGKNDYIAQANTGGWWQSKVTPTDWANWMTQQDITAGLHTIVANGAATHAHWNISIAGGDVSNGTFTGGSNSIVSYFDSVKNQSKPELQTLAELNPSEVAYYVSIYEWNAYKAYLEATFNSIPESYYLVVNGVPDRRILMYNGIPVIGMREWAAFDRINGVYSHFIYLAQRGVFGVAHDVDSLDPRGIGLDMVTWDVQPYKGRTFIDTDFKTGTAILDTDMLSRAHITLTP